MARWISAKYKENSRSSSKYVSLPSAPGTEQIRRVLRNVVHLFTRLRWPPMSFWLKKDRTSWNGIAFLTCTMWLHFVAVWAPPCRVVQCVSTSTFQGLGLQRPSHGRKRIPCHHQGFHFLGPKRSRQTLVLVDTNKVGCQLLCISELKPTHRRRSPTYRWASASRAVPCG